MCLSNTNHRKNKPETHGDRSRSRYTWTKPAHSDWDSLLHQTQWPRIRRSAFAYFEDSIGIDQPEDQSCTNTKVGHWQQMHEDVRRLRSISWIWQPNLGSNSDVGYWTPGSIFTISGLRWLGYFEQAQSTTTPLFSEVNTSWAMVSDCQSATWRKGTKALTTDVARKFPLTSGLDPTRSPWAMVWHNRWDGPTP